QDRQVKDTEGLLDISRKREMNSTNLYREMRRKRITKVINFPKLSKDIGYYPESVEVFQNKRFHKKYLVPKDLKEKILEIAKNFHGHQPKDSDCFDMNQKFQFLSQCEKVLGKKIPNTLLSKLQIFKDVIKFFSSPLKDCSHPLFELKQQDIPDNVSIQYDWLRYDPQTDKIFGGHSAYPGFTFYSKTPKQRIKTGVSQVTNEVPYSFMPKV
ncbi:MAG: hypothetical protein MHPSP_001293, partial [Paramarteilia canceri]